MKDNWIVCTYKPGRASITWRYYVERTRLRPGKSAVSETLAKDGTWRATYESQLDLAYFRTEEEAKRFAVDKAGPQR